MSAAPRAARALVAALAVALAGGVPSMAASAPTTGPASATAAASPSAPAAAADSVSTSAGTGPLGLHPCRLAGLEHDALCGHLRRPLDPAHPAGRHIDIHVAVLPALARQKLPDPVFFLAGGPGQSAIELAGAIERMVGRLANRRDIVLVDQRGTGRSAPLACDSPDAAESLARSFDRARMVAALDKCRQKLEALPYGDLRQFTTTVAMGDLDAVRAALGARQVDLVGVSYGTRAALEYLRLYPTHVRRVVLDAVAPPDMVLPASMQVDAAAALDALFADCARTPACARAHPALADTWQRLLASLPREVSAENPVDGRPERFRLTREAAWNLVRPGLYVPAMGAILPYAIEQAQAGRFEPLLALGESLGGPGGLDLFEGMHFSVVCAEDAPRLPPPGPADEDGAAGLYRAVCAHWPRGDVPAAFYSIPRSPAPVLLLSGQVDPVTPPRHARRVAQALGPLARLVVVPESGHGSLSLPCVHDAAVRFIERLQDADALRVDLGCVAGIPRPPAFTPPLPQRGASAPEAKPAGMAADARADPLPEHGR